MFTVEALEEAQGSVDEAMGLSDVAEPDAGKISFKKAFKRLKKLNSKLLKPVTMPAKLLAKSPIGKMAYGAAKFVPVYGTIARAGLDIARSDNLRQAIGNVAQGAAEQYGGSAGAGMANALTSRLGARPQAMGFADAGGFDDAGEVAAISRAATIRRGRPAPRSATSGRSSRVRPVRLSRAGLAGLIRYVPALKRVPKAILAQIAAPQASGLDDAGALEGTKYRVENGDYPYKITLALTGQGSRTPELLKANPQKPQANGNFKTLYAGELLNIPDAWWPIIKTRFPGAGTTTGGGASSKTPSGSTPSGGLESPVKNDGAGGAVTNVAAILQAKACLAAFVKKTGEQPADYGQVADLSTPAWSKRDLFACGRFQLWFNKNRGGSLRTDGILDTTTYTALVSWVPTAIGDTTTPTPGGTGGGQIPIPPIPGGSTGGSTGGGSTWNEPGGITGQGNPQGYIPPLPGGGSTGGTPIVFPDGGSATGGGGSVNIPGIGGGINVNVPPISIGTQSEKKSDSGGAGLLVILGIAALALGKAWR